MTSIPPRLAANYEKLATMRSLMATMKEQQSLRGPESYAARMAERAKKNTWRQMSGMQLFMHEINHKGNFPFVVGLGVVSVTMLWVYSGSLKSDSAKKSSDYWQRFHAKHE